MRNGYHPNLTFNTDLEKWKYDKFNKFLTQHPELYLSYLGGMGGVPEEEEEEEG